MLQTRQEHLEFPEQSAQDVAGVEIQKILVCRSTAGILVFRGVLALRKGPRSSKLSAASSVLSPRN